MIIHLIFSEIGFESCLELIKAEDRTVFFYSETNPEKCPGLYSFFKDDLEFESLILKEGAKTISWY